MYEFEQQLPQQQKLSSLKNYTLQKYMRHIDELPKFKTLLCKVLLFFIIIFYVNLPINNNSYVFDFKLDEYSIKWFIQNNKVVFYVPILNGYEFG